MNQSKQRRISSTWFDARSVMLFAALSVGGVAVQAQNAPAAAPRAAQTQSAGPSIGPGPGPGISQPSPAAPGAATSPSPATQAPNMNGSSSNGLPQPAPKLDTTRQQAPRDPFADATNKSKSR